jgi:hypothetical protein
MWALVGDAGYHRDPITALGMTDAFRDAELLTEALDAGLSGSRPLQRALADYERNRNQATAETYQTTIQFARLEPPPAEMQPLFEALRDNEEETGRFFGTVTGTVSVATLRGSWMSAGRAAPTPFPWDRRRVDDHWATCESLSHQCERLVLTLDALAGDDHQCARVATTAAAGSTRRPRKGGHAREPRPLRQQANGRGNARLRPRCASEVRAKPRLRFSGGRGRRGSARDPSRSSESGPPGWGVVARQGAI